MTCWILSGVMIRIYATNMRHRIFAIFLWVSVILLFCIVFVSILVSVILLICSVFVIFVRISIILFTCSVFVILIILVSIILMTNAVCVTLITISIKLVLFVLNTRILLRNSFFLYKSDGCGCVSLLGSMVLRPINPNQCQLNGQK